MPVDTQHFRNLDTQTGGRLEEILADYVAAGHRPERISRLIFAEYRFEVSRATVVDWLDKLGLAPKAPQPNGEPEARAS